MIRQLVPLFSFSSLIFASCASVMHIQIPAPRGALSVGRTSFVLIDSLRNEPWSPKTEPRTVMVKAWYPAQQSPTATRAPYLPNASRLPGQFQFGERFVASHLNSHAFAEPGVSPQKARYPMLLFSPGNDIAPDFYAGLLTELASRGYVVFAIDHSYEGKGQILPDGRQLTVEIGKFRPPPTSQAVFDFYRRRSDMRAADGIFVLDQLAQNRIHSPLTGRVNLDQIGALGHSIGGVAAGQMCRHDARFKACANLDGLARTQPLLPEKESFGLHQPFLYVGKPLGMSSPALDASTRSTIDSAIASGAGGYDVLIDQTNHDSFTDYPFFFPTIRPTNNRAALAIVRDVVVAFFDETLLGKPSDVLTDSVGYKGRVSIKKIPAAMR